MLNDLLTLARIREGDIKAFEDVFRRYYSPLCWYAMSITGSMEAAEEIVEELFYGFWRDRERLPLFRSMKSYLYIAVRNQSFQYCEHQEVRNKYREFVLSRKGRTQDSNPQEEMEYQELRHLIDATLARMPERRLRIFRMHRMEGKKYAEIASQLSLSVKTVEAEMTKALKALKKEIENYQVPCLAYMGDMGDMDCCKELFAKIKKQFGGIDVLVNNAGVSYIGLLQDMSSEDWDKILHMNLTSVFNCCKLAIPYMVHQKQGKIINISSVWGVAGASCEAAYSATKGGINALTRALAKELGPSNIQVNAIACGAIDTEMNQWMEEDELIALVDEIPAGRLGKAEEVADLAYHLGYKESYLTGQIIGLDGGWI